MKRYLLFISLLICLLPTVVRASSFFPSSEGERKDYAITIQFKSLSFTGVCIVKQAEGLLVGTIVNEFGIKAMDFTVKNRKKVKLQNVLPMLNKWYIRKIVKADFKYIFQNVDAPTHVAHKNREMTFRGEGVEMCNTKYDICYLFNPLSIEP